MITRAILTSMPLFMTISIASAMTRQKKTMELFTRLTYISLILYTIIFWAKLLGKLGMIL